MKDTYTSRHDEYMELFDKRYKEILWDGTRLDLYTGPEHSSIYHVQICFMQQPDNVYIAGDMGDWIFGRITYPRTFFRTTYANIPYWSKKVISISKWGGGVEDENIDADEVLKALTAELKEQEIPESTIDEIMETIDQDKLCRANEVAYIELDDVLSDFDVYMEGETLSGIITGCQKYSDIFIYICMLLNWIENKMDLRAYENPSEGT